MAKTYKKRAYTADPEQQKKEFSDYFDSSVKDLLAEIQQGGSQRYLEYVKFMSNFHKYSFRNGLLIMMQARRMGFVPSKLMGFMQWQELGLKLDKEAGINPPRPLQVRKMGTVLGQDQYGNDICEQGIRIVHPFTYKRINKDTGEEETGVYFDINTRYPIVDVSQLTQESQERVPQFFARAEGDATTLVETLLTCIRNAGIVVEAHSQKRIDLDLGKAGAGGYSAIGKIVYADDLPSVNTFLVLVHELAHELLHDEALRREMTSQQKEYEAETTAYMVGMHFGIKSPYSADYLVNWKMTEKDLKQHMERIRKTAEKIIDMIEQNSLEQESEDEAA